MILLDSHIIVWLYIGKRQNFSAKALNLIEQHELAISPISYLEIQYLYEIGRIKKPAREIINTLETSFGLVHDNPDWLDTASRAIDLSWTRDPFDRLLVAHSLAHNLPLLTKDKKLLECYANAVWE